MRIPQHQRKLRINGDLLTSLPACRNLFWAPVRPAHNFTLLFSGWSRVFDQTSSWSRYPDAYKILFQTALVLQSSPERWTLNVNVRNGIRIRRRMPPQPPQPCFNFCLSLFVLVRMSQLAWSHESPIIELCRHAMILMKLCLSFGRHTQKFPPKWWVGLQTSLDCYTGPFKLR